MAPARTWQHLFPPVPAAGPLTAIDAYLTADGARDELARCERERRFPRAIVGALRERGLADLFVGWDERTTATAPHLFSLNAIAAQASGSLAITLGVNSLALLPAYVAAAPDQLAEIRRRVEGGAFVALLLTEWDAGSNLVAIGTRADRSSEGADALLEVTGEKQLINLAVEAELLMTLVRTAAPAAASGLGAATGLSLLLIDRDPSVRATARWETAPVPAADIGGVRFEGTRVPRTRVIGAEGDGFGVVQRTLTISRGGVSAVAAGTSNRALGLALAHARSRILYGAPIVKLEPIAHHLCRMAAWDLGATCLAIKAGFAVNALGQGAAHQTAVAKLACCDLAERATIEGRHVLGARSLLSALPFQQVALDVWLYGIFDGTRHVMLDQIQWRLRQLAARADEPDAPAPDLYRLPPRVLTEAARSRGRPWVPAPTRQVARLAGHPGGLDLEPLHGAAALLEDVARRLDAAHWSRPSLTFALGESLALIEAAIAIAELADPARRLALGAGGLRDAGPLPFAELAEFAIATLAGQVSGDVFRIGVGAGLDLDGGTIGARLARSEARSGGRLREALRDAV